MNFGETSLIVNALGASIGSFAFIAKGYRNNKSAVCLCVLSEYELCLYEPTETGLYLLSEASCLQEFNPDTSSVLTVADLCGIELLSQIYVHGEESAIYFDLIQKYLEYQKKLRANHIAIFWRLFLRVMHILGIELNPTQCRGCTNLPSGVIGYNMANMELLCANCMEDTVHFAQRQYFSEESCKLLGLLPQIGDFHHELTISRRAATEINAFLIAYLRHHMNRDLHLKSLKVFEQFYP